MDGKPKKNIQEWTERKHGKVDYYPTQFFLNHEYFCSYLNKMRKTQTAACKFCGYDKDDAEHSFLDCIKWQAERNVLQKKIGIFNSDNIIDKMLLNEERWTAVAKYIHTVLRVKKENGFRDNQAEVVQA
ncbi:uncharacterized protein LOC106636364 [Copidosoma floridanum]|uniref:uncharacterized protein LOC106636364 n=1 Tax=Copidosoma floridanum TaxID=29053 RepID=UPI0006C9C37E|nr:uncharacterized protein LOC106636364 [Copidosoma floridanum]